MNRQFVGAMMTSAAMWLCGLGVARADIPLGQVLGQPETSNSYEEGDEAWREGAAKLPPLPSTQSLLGVDVMDASRNQYFVDPDSLLVGGDGVSRLTLIVQHKSGNRTVTYEGIRCETGEYRIYGIAGEAGWAAPKRSPWRSIPLGGYKSLRSVLLTDFLCDVGLQREASKVLSLLRHPSPKLP